MGTGVITGALGIGVLGSLWFVIRRKQYRSLLMAAYLLSVMYYGVMVDRAEKNLTDSDAVHCAQNIMFTGISLECLFGLLVMRESYLQAVGDYEARKLRETA